MAAADRAFAVEDWETVVSKAYYAVYHAIIAALEARVRIRRRSWGHAQVMNDFRLHFARRGFLFTVREAQELSALYSARVRADYEPPSLRRRQTETLLAEAHALVAKVQEVIG